jgi:hypothetical protein
LPLKTSSGSIRIVPLRARFLLLVLFPAAACTCDDELGELNGAIEVIPPSLDFGMVPRDLAKELPLTLKNRGLFPLKVDHFSAAAPFIAPTVTATTIGTGSQIQVMVAFKPSELGAAEGLLEIHSDDPKTPVVTVPLVGTGIEAAVRVEPSIIDFGEVLWILESPREQVTVTVSNPGSDTFELTELALTESAMGSFVLDPGMAVGSYAPGQSKTFVVSYRPKARAAVMGSVRIATTTRMAPEIIIPLRGKGVGPEINICASANNGPETCTQAGEIPRAHFNDLPINTTQSGTVRVLNTGERELTIIQTFLTGTQPEFSFTPSVPGMNIVLAPGAENMWTVTYSPVDYTFDAVLLAFSSNDPRPPDVVPRSVDIRGGVASARIRVQPGSLTFSHSGAVTHGETPVRIFNCGLEPLILTNNIVLMQTAGPEPALSLLNAPAQGTTIMPQPMCEMGPPGVQMTVVFDTSMNGNYTGEIAIASNDPTKPQETVRITASKR